MRLSYVIVTHNRRERLLETLGNLYRSTPEPRDSWEIYVVDNASTDGTVQAVQTQFPKVHVIALLRNEGVYARSLAFPQAKGQYMILLDDDSYPVGDAAVQSMKYLDRHPACAAVVGRAELPDGSFEASALPSVMLSCAVCLRRILFDQLEGFRPEFFRKAGEYDVSFRIWQAGYAIERFEDVVYKHDKFMLGRDALLAHRMDVRNNLILIERFLPRPLRRIYRHDWLRRYAALATYHGHVDAVSQAIDEAREWAQHERTQGRQTLDDRTLEIIFSWREQERRVKAWATERDLRRVLIADYSKNLYATYRACRKAGLSIVAIADRNKAYRGHTYRDVPILDDDRSLSNTFDGIVVSNVNPAQIDRRIAQLDRCFDGPILRLWHPRQLRTTDSRASNTSSFHRTSSVLEVN